MPRGMSLVLLMQAAWWGWNSNGSISNSYATGDVSASDYAGGLVGRSSGSISNSYATGMSLLLLLINSYAGGLAGYMDSSSISNSYATGDVSASSSSASHNAYSGGLVGNVERSSNISNSYATGDVSASASYSYSGGLVGRMFW